MYDSETADRLWFVLRVVVPQLLVSASNVVAIFYRGRRHASHHFLWCDERCSVDTVGEVWVPSIPTTSSLPLTYILASRSRSCDGVWHTDRRCNVFKYTYAECNEVAGGAVP